MNAQWTKIVLVAALGAASAWARDAAPAAGGGNPPSVRIAIFPLQADPKGPLPPEALTDRVLAVCGTIPNVTLVDRAEMVRVATEQKMTLSGLTDPSAGVKLGHLLAASHIIVGRLSTIGQSHYLILKVVDVETTAQHMVSVRVPVAGDIEKLFENIDTEVIAALQPPTPTPQATDDAAALAKSAAWLRGKTLVIDVSETHVSRPLADPACSTSLFNQLKALDVNAILPNAPAAGWKDALRSTGMYQETKVDYLLEGEGVSSFAAEIQGMTSCRARVELRLVAVPGREVKIAKSGVGAEVDLVEALAAKAALEEASRDALKALLEAGAKAP